MNYVKPYYLNEKLSGFYLNNKLYCFLQDDFGEIISITNNDNKIIDVSYDECNKIVLNIKDNKYYNLDLIKIILLTVPFTFEDVILDYETGNEYSPKSLNNLNENINNYEIENKITLKASKTNIYVYLYKPTGLSTNPFGHLDININNQIHSYAAYESGNYLIASSIPSYQRYQRKKYSITSCAISVTSSEKSKILGFYNAQNKTKKATSNNFHNGTIYKINTGKYKTYKLTSVNCATFVLDGLKSAFNERINYLTYTYKPNNTPSDIFKICQKI